MQFEIRILVISGSIAIGIAYLLTIVERFV